MSSVFDAYAAYYDLLYAGKDYAGEASYVDALIQRHRPGARTLLELGAGTGGHALHFAKLGYAVQGIDLSPAMVARACMRADDADLGDATPTFKAGDLRTFRAGQRFDAVVALFHVMSYQVGDDDLRAAMETVCSHLVPGGVFVFDCWYGPGVRADPPVVRERKFSDGGVTIARTARPAHFPDRHRVDVLFDIVVADGEDRARFEECHAMRYLFLEEVDTLLACAGLKRVAATAWMGDEDDLRSATPWYVCFAAVR